MLSTLPETRFSLVLLILWGSLMNLPVAIAESPPELDSKRAFDYLVQICRIGPRPSGSAGMNKQQTLLIEHFSQFDVQVKLQPFDARDPLSGVPVRMNNMLIQWHPEAQERLLLCCHYDTRPYPDRDRNPLQRRGTFIGANDGGSGVALFMELAHNIRKINPTFGIDFVLFDGEELIYGDQGKYFLGSEYFAKEYRDHPPEHRYIWGVVVDMIGDRTLNIYQERNSLKYAPDLVRSIWKTANRMGAKQFVPKVRHEVLDDHLPLNDIARIPSIDIIDFDYPQWHTSKDIPANCSGESLAIVGNVLLQWMQEVPQPSDPLSGLKR